MTGIVLSIAIMVLVGFIGAALAEATGHQFFVGCCVGIINVTLASRLWRTV